MTFSDYIVPVIAAGVYLIFLMIKPVMTDKSKPFIPLLAGVLGVLLMAWYTWSFGFDVFLTGLASGLAATGIDQAVKIPLYTTPDESAGD